ncbi:hypothetical protein ACFQZS_00470 [Mucilaginibacter calamicampi]|uniref:Lipocalin-like domain-containing protein n=1 Tax=Mucilaginibacter calamicampi TaxID=1302352 RepID=A0ABW2YT42_9SPHI
MACKKDVPLYPGDPGFVPYKGTASTTNTSTTIDETLLTGNWEIISTRTEVYSATNTVLTSFPADINPFISIQLNNFSKGFLAEGAVTNPLGSYTLSKSGTKTYMQLSVDPFNRLTNEKILIVSLTATAMTWIAYGSAPESAGTKSGAKIVFIKKP